MKLLDRTFPTPELNLACDEALLEGCENGDGDETLRFWEADRSFVVVGHGNRVAAEVNLETCRALGVPVLRRCSGGGAVLQGPGCLNYAVILRIDREPGLQSVTRTNAFVMGCQRAALASILPGRVQVQGFTDLTLDGRKFSGNAQRRKRGCVLFHGTLLLRLDISLLERLLPRPTRQPDYRADRPHREFLQALGLPADSVKAALREAWGAHESLEPPPTRLTERLARDRYSTPAWNFKL
jgi:lipoate---protein ligase